MEILETIEVTVAPLWLFILFLIGGALLLVAFLAHDADFAPIIAIVGLILLITSIILGHNKVGYVYDHDEYIVELTDITASEFNEKYEVVKTFDYSNAVQVKERKK
jgi:hypothetical protein